jgi:GNAT superfamily N-acetyltransferase
LIITIQNIAFQVFDLGLDEAKNLVDAVWPEQMTKEDEDSHWRWYDLVKSVEDDYFSEIKGLRTSGGSDIEAIVWYEKDAKSVLEEGFGAIYVSRLAVAPWNRVSRNHRRYRGLGKLLIQYVVWRSWNLGLKGRTILEALPGAEEFYLHLGFREIGIGEDDLKSYELPKDKAKELLKEFNI